VLDILESRLPLPAGHRCMVGTEIKHTCQMAQNKLQVSKSYPSYPSEKLLCPRQDEHKSKVHIPGLNNLLHLRNLGG
jgi:hypothetical protein